MAILDSEFVLRASRHPEVVSALVARALRRSRHIATNMAIVQQPRIDLRLHMLFWELADRWGIVRQDGVHVPLHLTHATLSDLVAARRPTVTKALGELAQRSAVIWTGSDWLLPGEPPDELDDVGSLTIAEPHVAANRPAGVQSFRPLWPTSSDSAYAAGRIRASSGARGTTWTTCSCRARSI